MMRGPPEARLNEEVTEEDIAAYDNILLTEADPDAGHITMRAIGFRSSMVRTALLIESSWR